jgi:hypothetical protein
MTEATCTSTDPTNHQGDTCPVHEQEATKRPWGYVHHKGLDQHLVGATLENVAIVEDRHGNAKENSEFIVKAVNSHDALVVAIEDMEQSRENLEGLVQRLTIQNDALVAASEIYKVVLVLCKEALMNVPVVGEPYDQRHSDFQMNAYNIVIEALEQVK